jgi:hypothetical protein
MVPPGEGGPARRVSALIVAVATPSAFFEEVASEPD